MKKKGFTLVELLAVIAILAILVIIALPNVLGMFNDAKKSTFNTEIQSIFKQAQTDFVQDSLELSGAQVYCKGLTIEGITCNNALQITTTKNYYVAMDSAGNITNIAVSDGSFVYAKTGTISVTDIKKDDIQDASSNKLIKDSDGKIVVDSTTK